MRIYPSTRNRIGNIFIAMMFVGVGLVFVTAEMKRYNLNKSYKSGTGNINEVFTARGMNGFSIRFTYAVNGNEFHNSSRLVISKRNQNFLKCLLEGKSFPIIYESGNPRNSKMILLPEDFDEYKISIPDLIKEEVSIIEKVKNYRLDIDSVKSNCVPLFK